MTAPAHRRVCAHLHLYQPPRENPWTGEVEREESARPFHDWNERVAEECYWPLALGGRPGSDGRLIAAPEILGRVSFNAGPTLLDWMQRRRPELYRRVIAADLPGEDGLGNAIAQPYFHVILPLAPRRDKETLVRWGIADFSARFGRRPRGMWLPETAVDDETLDVLAAEGIEFTILDPRQAAESRPVGGRWRTETALGLDASTPYRWISASGRSLAVFFYDGPLSAGVVSGETTAGAGAFSRQVRARLRPDAGAQLVLLASDGEFYGHHHRGADRALSLGLDVLEAEGLPAVNLSRFLALFPPPREVRIRPRTAWSCPHGLGRWEGDCGCRSAHLPAWSQAWRGPMREAFDALAGRVDALYEREAARLFPDPWALRDASIALRLDRSPAAARRFLDARAGQPLADEEAARARRLLALQRARLAMFTSCGWFFDDPSGLEAVHVLRGAALVCDLARGLGEDLEPAFLEALARAPSNVKELKDAASVYRRRAARARVCLERLAVHAALFRHLGLPAPAAPSEADIPEGEAGRVEKAGRGGRGGSLSWGTVRVAREAFGEAAAWDVVVHRADRLDFAVWLAPVGAADGAILRREFLRLEDDDLRASLDLRFGASRFGLDAALEDERESLVRALTPEGGLGPERAAYLREWTAAVAAARAGAGGDDALLDLLALAERRGFRPGLLPWADALEDLMAERLERAADGGGPAAVSLAWRWLDALSAAGLLRGAWRLRDAQRRWSARLAGAEPSVEGDACRALGERLGLAEPMLEA